MSRVGNVSSGSAGNTRNALSGFLDSLDQDEIHEQIIVSELRHLSRCIDFSGGQYRLPLS
jgi:hypothetical protein